VAGFTSWNSEGSTRVRGVPDWRRLDLLRRPEVKQLMVRSAKGMELLPEEGAED